MPGPEPLPVTVLTGFLGAGKTTLLKRILEAPHGRRIGVILNELGQTGIEDVAREAQRVDLENGCVCCVRADDLVAALRAMQARGDVDLVILETTGVADPLVLTWILTRPDLADVASLDCVITVVDAINLARTQTEEWQAQVRCADLCVIAKLDLAPPGARQAVEAQVQSAGGTDRFIDATGELPIGLLLDTEGDPRALPHARPHGVHSAYGALSLVSHDIHDATRFEDWLETLPPQVFRAKGIVKTGPARWLRFHTVGGRLDVDPTAPAPAHGESRLVFLGPDLDRQVIEAELRATRAS